VDTDARPETLPELTPAPRRRPFGKTAVLVAALVGLVGAGLALSGSDDRHPAAQTASAAQDPAAAPAEAIDADTTSTTAATGTTSSSDGPTSSTAKPATVTTHRVAPTSTTTRPPSTTTTSGPARGVVLSADQPGIWVADLETGTLRRAAAEAGPFDIAGDFVLTAKGRKVFATPLGGGDTVLRYEAPSQGNPQFSSGYTFDPSREAVDTIDAGADGSAVVGVFGPVIAPDGTTVGRNGNYFLLNPSGQRVMTPFIQSWAWSADGTRLAITSFAATSPPPIPSTSSTTTPPAPHGTIVVLKPDGSVVHGPVDAPETQTVSNLRWAGDGRSLLFDTNGTIRRYDLGSGRFTLLPGQPSSAEVGLDGRILTTRYVPQNDSAVDFLDPVTGARTPFLPRGQSPGWSPDGKSVLVAVVPPPAYGNTPYPLTVFDTAGTARFTMASPDQLVFGRPAPLNVGPHPAGPQWSISSRYVVFGAYPR
jgi:hypothetical protein